MPAPTEKTLNAGLRYASIFELNTSGTPKATSTTAYEGIQVVGSTAFELNVPDARKITGLGEDGVTQVLYLPPNESADGKLNVDGVDMSLATLLDNVKARALGEMTMIGVATNQQGFEPQVGLQLYQAAVGLSTGKMYWHTYFMPSSRVIRKAHGMTADKSVTVYQIAPNRTSRYLWGEPFTNADDGFLSGQIIEAWSNYPYRVAAFVADGTAVDFSFPVNTPAVQTTGIKVFKNDVLVTTGITLSVSKVTFAVAPTLADRIVILREVAG